jgi:hypothetical protein
MHQRRGCIQAVFCARKALQQNSGTAADSATFGWFWINCRADFCCADTLVAAVA